MKVQALELDRPAYGDNRDKLQGRITLKDENNNELVINLTPAGISRLVAAISSEVVETLRHVALQAPRALQHAQDEGYLLESDGKISLPEEK